MSAASVRPRFDPTINLGHLLSLAGVTIAVAGGWYVADWRLSALERQMERLSAVVTESARNDERLKEVKRRLDSLERR
jgi:hypothetical protein